MLGVVLEQGVDPCGAVAGSLVGGVGADGSGAAPDGGATGSVGDEHLLAEQLGDQACIRGLGAACAGARELKKRLFVLARNNVCGGSNLGLLGNGLYAVIKCCLLSVLALAGYHFK